MCSSNEGNDGEKGEKERGLAVPKGAINKFYLWMFLNHHLAQAHGMTSSLTSGLQYPEQWRPNDNAQYLSNFALTQ